MITLRQIEYLIAIAETGNFGRAALKCNVSQPGLSSQLKLMEDQLGAQLVERNNKQAILTNTGEQVLAMGRNMLYQRNSIVELCKQKLEPLSGDLIMGVIPTIAPYLLPTLLPQLKRKFPKLNLYLREIQTSTIIEDLANGHIDIGLLALPINDDRFTSSLLFSENFVLAAPKNHRLANQHNLNPKSLTPNSMLLLEEGHCLRDQTIDICKMENNDAGNAHFKATSLETLKFMVAEGLGITLLPEMAIDKKHNYATSQFSDPIPQRKIGLIWRRTTTRKAEFELLTSAIKSLR